MRTNYYVYLLTLFIAFTASLGAQHKLSDAELAAVPLTALPMQDNDRLLREELARRKPGRPRTFAVTVPTDLRPTNSGKWGQEGSNSVWRLRIKSLGAISLNLGFSEYRLPDGAELYISTPDERLGPFTVADNEDHNQLWTPIVDGDELLLTLYVPTRVKKAVQLYLTAVNHDFEGITKSLSGDCNLDVICDADDGWAIVDQYRDIIRSVAAYTLNGREQCTGFLINNTNQDGRPFFMTANHCGVRENNSAGVVAYWNFEWPTCRELFTAENGEVNYGSRNSANTGTIFRSRSANSDMCLLEFDDPIDEDADPFFAGWDLSPLAPTDTSVAIHHPAVHEKRISFTFNDVYRSTGDDVLTENPDGSFLTVSSWSVGTTEGGSSGSPIFDGRGLVRGQLFRGSASCTNTEGYDQYGFFASSWEGDGTMDSSLKGWLDPCGLGAERIGGFDGRDQAFTLTADDNCLEACTTSDLTFRYFLGAGYTLGANIETVENDLGVDPSFSPSTSDGRIVVDATVPSESLAEGSYTLTLRVSENGRSDDITFTVDIATQSLSAPTLLAPEDERANVSPVAAFSWTASAGAESYELQVSESPDFSSLVNSGEFTTPSGQLDAPLIANRTYYWRVRAVSLCATTEWVSASFTVANVLCGGETADVNNEAATIGDVPGEAIATIDIDRDLNLFTVEVSMEIIHSYVGDLTATLTAPGGQTVTLFTNPVGGNCFADNLLLTFSDDAANTSAQFDNTCSFDGSYAIEGSYQPNEALSAFTGVSTRGTWTLTVTDDAEDDGGRIADFTLNFCGEGEQTDYSVISLQNDLTTCRADAPVDLTFTLGGSFDTETQFTIQTEAGFLTTATAARVEGTDQVVLTITDWEGLAVGDYTITVIFESGDGVSQSVEVPLIFGEAAEPARLLTPEDGAVIVNATEVEFSWLRALGAETYNIQYSVDPTFERVDFTADAATMTEVTLQELPAGQTIYWRVISNNDLCGNAVSAVNSFTIQSTSTQNFGDGSTLGIYPTPATDRVVIELLGAWPEGVEGELFDAAGRRVRSLTTLQPGRSQFDVSQLADGMYFLRVTNGARRHTERIVIVR